MQFDFIFFIYRLKETVKAVPTDIIIFEGILALYDEV